MPAGDRLEKVLEKLQSSIGTGRAGLATSVAAVREWLEGYWTEIWRSTGAVTNEISKLKDESIGDKSMKLVSLKNDMELIEQLSTWKDEVGSIFSELNSVDTKHVSKLDNVLQTRIVNEIKVVKEAVQVLYDSAGEKEFVKEVSAVDETLVAQKNKMNECIEAQSMRVNRDLHTQETQIAEAITERSEELKRNIHTLFWKIGDAMANLRNEKKTHFSAIKMKVKDSQKLVGEYLKTFEGSYKYEIRNRFYELKGKLVQVNKDDISVGSKDNMSTLHQDFLHVRRKVGDIRDTLQEYSKTVDVWINKTKMDIESAIKKAEEIINKKPGEAHQAAINQAAAEIKKRTGILKSQFDLVKSQLGVEVDKLKGSGGPLSKLENLKGQLSVAENLTEFENTNWDLRKHIDGLKAHIQIKMWDYIKEYISLVQGKVGNIKGQSQEDGLQGIKKRVWEQYAQKFKDKGTFKTAIVDDWIQHILQYNAVVKYWFKKYVDSKQATNNFFKPDYINDGKDGFSALKIKEMATAIGEQLDTDVTEKATANYSGRQEAAVEANLKAVKEVCEKFADALGNHIAPDGLGKMTTKIAGRIHSTLKRSASSAHDSSIDTICLEKAVRATLSALQSKARQCAYQIDELVEERGCRFKNVDGALQTAVELIGNLAKATNSNAIRSHGVAPHIAGQKAVLGDNLKQAIEAEVNGGTVNAELGKLLKATVDKAIHKLHDKIQEDVVSKLKLVDKNVNAFEAAAQEAETALTQAATEVESKLTNVTKSFEEAGRNVKFYLDNFKNIKIDHELKGLKDHMNVLQNETNSIIKAANDNILETVKLLEDVPALVDRKINEVDSLMMQVKQEFEKLQYHIDYIESFVNAADVSLTSYIDSVGEALKTAQRNANDAVSNLKLQLTDRVKCAFQESRRSVSHLQSQLLADVQTSFTKVTMQVRQLFAEGHKSDLKALRTLVGRQLKTIERIITADFKNGLKGLIRTLMGVPADGSHGQGPNKLEPLGFVPTVDTFSPKIMEYLEPIFNYILGQLNLKSASGRVGSNDRSAHPITTSHDPNVSSIFAMFKNVSDILRSLGILNAFNHATVKKIHEADEAIEKFRPSKFQSTSSNTLLDIIKSGFKSFVAELKHVYVSRYSGATDTFNWAVDGNSDKCAKVCLTLLETLSEDLGHLKNECKDSWSSRRIHAASSLGTFLQKSGYRVATSRDSQDGELQRHVDMKGSNIYTRLVGEYNNVFNKDKNTKNALENIHSYLNLYYAVCHIAASLSTRRPCSIYEMLGWLTSLVHHPVYFELTTNDFGDLFDKPKKAGDNAAVDGITFEEPGSLLLSAYPQNLTPGDLHDAVMHVTSLAPVILTTIVGYGDEFTTYAVDYHSNASGFAIPSSASSCLSMLLELMRRLFPVFRFLHSRCSNLSSEYGWYHCAYGSDVESAGWQCKDHSKTNVDCLPRSPLMSYLRDSLPGHLPHQLTSVDCKSECKTCPKSTPGMPCITPLGFKGFSGSKRTGKDISNVLTKFFDKGVASCLLSLSPRPPSSLPEHFGFTLSLVRGLDRKMARSLIKWVDESITKQSIELYTGHELTDAITKAYGSTQSDHDKHHAGREFAELCSLSMKVTCSGKDALCAPYLSTLFTDTYHYFGQKHCNLYLSWAIYLPWTFWDLLNNLYNAFCSINCQDWGCRGCLRGDKCKKGEHGVIEDEKKATPNCQCTSIVDCKGVAPTLYQYGFVFGEASTLNDKTSPKKCSDFCSQLKKVLESQYFKDLFEECDNFLWTIRTPFTYLVLALWLLSLFYLTHIMVIRLDLLHIKSHLHSPSSHRIAAQSLLAAARVNKLNRVFYLQP